MLWSEQVPTSAPVLRVYLFGECILERLVVGSEEAGQTPRYERVSNDEWKGRGPALALLKLLLCRHHRRAMKDELVAALWPEPDEDEEEKRLKNADRALDAAVSVLRKVLGTAHGSSLLAATSSGDGTIYKLPDQACLWVDADAFEQSVHKALRVTHPQEAIPLWEAAYHLTQRGEFLEEDCYRDWARPHRDALAGRIGNCVYTLADLYVLQQRPEQAQDLLWQYIVDHPTDEDMLYHLLLLLERQDRLSTGWQLYQRVKGILAREGLSLAPRIKALAKRINSQRMALETRVSERGLMLARPTVGIAENSGLSADCATWFAVKQAEIIDLIEQWKGHALHCDELQAQLYPLLDVLNERQPGHSSQAHLFSRRQVLLGIAALALPLLFSGRHTDRLSLFAEEFLPQCAAAILACRHLMQGQDFSQAEQILMQYLPILETLMQQHSPYQSKAAHLVLQCDNYLGVLAIHRLQWTKAEHYHNHAVYFSQFVPDQNVQAITYIQLAIDHFYLGKPIAALEVYQKAQASIQVCSPWIQTNYYIHQAASHAQNGQTQEAQQDLVSTHKHLPTRPEDDPAFLLADFEASSIPRWKGFAMLELTRHGAVEPQEAWDSFTEVERANPDMAERNRVQLMNNQTTAALVMRDLDRFCTYLRRGIEGADRLGSARRRQEALLNYWQARTQWPHEQRVKDMAELFIPHRPSSEVRA